LRTDGRANAGFGTADLVIEALQPAARLREAGVSTLMVDTEQGAADSTCLRLADLPSNTLALAVRLSLRGWREGATP
jgi:Mg-chelatase subunit ChlD